MLYSLQYWKLPAFASSKSSNGKKWKRRSQTPHIVTRWQHEMLWNTKNSISEEEKAFFLFFLNWEHNQTLEQWSRKLTESPSLEMLKIQLDTKPCASGSKSPYFEQVDWTREPPEIFDNLRCTVSGWLWNLTLHCWHWNTHLGCGQLSFKKYSSRTFGHLKNCKSLKQERLITKPKSKEERALCLNNRCWHCDCCLS